jgi:hypothetical protein
MSDTMGYLENPYNSSEGRALLLSIFNDIFLVDPSKRTELEQTNKELVVSNFITNTPLIIAKMKRFAKGYSQIPISEAWESGVYVCPHCQRRDFMYEWESVDIGIYNSQNSWLSSVALEGWSGGLSYQNGRFAAMHRVRCNKVTTCNDCHLTMQRKRSNCTGCGSSDVANVGCLKESYAMHFILEKTTGQLFPTGGQHRQVNIDGWAAIEQNRMVPIPRSDGMSGLKSPLRASGLPVGYQFATPSLPTNPPSDITTAYNHIPSIAVQYGTRGEVGRAKYYPLSQMRYAFTRIPQKMCVDGKIMPDTGKHAHPNKQERITTPDGRCRLCDAEYPPAIQNHGSFVYPPEMFRIESPQPLNNANVLSAFNGLPVWEILLTNPTDRQESSNTMLCLPQVFSLLPIPEAPDINMAGQGITSCPNDIGFQAGVQEALNESDYEDTKQDAIIHLKLGRAKLDNMRGQLDGVEIMDIIEEGKASEGVPNDFGKNSICAILESDAKTVTITDIQKLTKQWKLKILKSNVTMFGAFGESGPNYTYAICEGKSRKATKNDLGLWVDESPPCRSFRDGSGNTLPTAREYPRFNFRPDYAMSGYPDATVGNDYLWLEPLTHVVSDLYHKSPFLDKAMSTTPQYHGVVLLESDMDYQMHIINTTYECATCRGAVDNMGIINYRRAENQLDKDGKSIDEFYPQEVIDMESDYEKNGGFNDDGQPIAWGVLARGKKILKGGEWLVIE